MKWKVYLTTILFSVLVAGCDSHICAGKTVWMKEGTPEWLAENDREALESIVVNNENRAQSNCVN